MTDPKREAVALDILAVAWIDRIKAEGSNVQMDRVAIEGANARIFWTEENFSYGSRTFTNRGVETVPLVYLVRQDADAILALGSADGGRIAALRLAIEQARSQINDMQSGCVFANLGEALERDDAAALTPADEGGDIAPAGPI